MSASLVGSEMCIRDSKIWALVLAGRSMNGVAPTSASWVLTVLSARSLACCLLYTSDAADDM
eukprot:4142642-Alexandrium_andersonii.AAC.1